MISVKSAAQTLGGQVAGANKILVPGPGHSRRDRSLQVTFGDKFPEGFAVYSYAGDDFRVCRDYVRDRLSLPAWQPSGDYSRDEQPIYVAREYIYTTASGDNHHRVEQLSDGGFRHYTWDIDGWVSGVPSLLYPYGLSEFTDDPTVYVVQGEHHAELLRDGFGVNATTYPSGTSVNIDPSFLYHLQGREIRLLHTGGARSAEFLSAWPSEYPVYDVPEGFRTLRQYAADDTASADGFVLRDPDTAPSDTDISDTPLIRATPFQWCDPASIPPRAWLYGNHLIRKFVSTTVSPGGLGKSSLSVVEALSMTSGRPLLSDNQLHEPEPLTVWLWNGEDPNEETQRRVIAAAVHYNLRPDDFASRLYTDSGRDLRLKLASMARGETLLDESVFEQLTDEIIRRGVDVLVLDPLVSAHNVSENDNGAIDAIVKRLGIVADRANCAIELVHHVRKPSGDAETTVNDARGASALIGGVRSARVLNGMSADTATEIGIPVEDRHFYFSVTNGKSNMSARSGTGLWRRLVSVCLNNGTPDRGPDHIGVVTEYTLPARAPSYDLSNAETVAIRLLSECDTYRHWLPKGRKPSGWLGDAILGELGIDDEQAAYALRKTISGWISDKIITVRTGHDGKHQAQFLTLSGGSIRGEEYGSDSSDSPF